MISFSSLLEFLDTPPGFKNGMKFERKVYDDADVFKSQPQKIYLSDVLAMDDMPELEDLVTEAEEIDLKKVSYFYVGFNTFMLE